MACFAPSLADESSKYEDTIQRLKDKVNDLYSRLATEERKVQGPAESSQLEVINQSGVPESEVHNKIQNMRLNFELLEKKLGQEQIGNLPDSGRVYVVSGGR